ncbi:DUF1684 domain-containing protein [Specibacter cremeus]|uniref:DUF1684 domain-containing protein n=1 Tax=Specibacter cremeus TaxID=1629051 RepID=UPI000F79F033|nr:DUF1684 domain-containing protein [Specibacter cremeus]
MTGRTDTATTADAQTQRWNRFRTNRDAALATDHGWLTLTSFQWLPETPAPLDLVPGLWSTDGTTATLTAGAHDGLTLVADGSAVTGTLTATLADEESLMWVRHGSIVVELAMRADRYLIRTRDSASPVLTGFTGVPTFVYDPALVLTGRFERYPEPRTVAIDTAHQGVPGRTTLVGDVVFDLGGGTHRLAAEEGALGSLILTFSDPTNNVTTSHWRKLELARPRPDGSVVVDFNRTINYPSAFTDFGTCPAPVPGNAVTVPVEAGERDPRVGD